VDPRRPPPAILRKAWQALSYHALPRVGGLDDQPAGQLAAMTRIHNIWLAHKSYARRDLAHDVEWRKDNPDLYDIILLVKELRLQNGQ
jgi:hypothetical protein